MSGDTREMYVDPLKGASAVTIEVPLLEETLRDAKALTEGQKWSEQEGLQIIFVNGLYYLRGERQLQEVPGWPDGLGGEVQRLTTELIDMQSKYAVMKFRAFTLDQAKQVLEFNVVGLEGENRLSAWRLQKFREDEELLRAELGRVKEENEQLRQRLALFEGQIEVPQPRPGFVRRLIAWLGR
jgi:hypothetical protein